MNYDEFIRVIINSAAEDWLHDDDLGIYVLKDNVSISILNDRDFEGDFFEEWVEKYPDPKAYAKRFLLKYNNSVVEPFYAAAVDGFRMFIPYPKRPEMKISLKQYEIGRIINQIQSGNSFNDYLSMAGIKVSN